jgi:hypothetical protein
LVSSVSKPFTDADFFVQVTEDRSWRLREISDLKSTILRADEKSRRVLLRALVTICYAHWEGYVRFAARKYLEYVALRKFRYRELDPQFRRNYFLPSLAKLSGAKTSITDRCTVIDAVLNSSDLRYATPDNELINTKANLRFDVFADICIVCCIPVQSFLGKADFVDKILVKRRNEIAHGEDVFVSIDDLDFIANETIEIMRAFGDELENHVVLQRHRVA